MKDREIKEKMFKHLCETRPHWAYLKDRSGFVRHAQEVREKLVGKAPSRQEIERALDLTK